MTAERRIIHATWGAGQLVCDGVRHYFLAPDEHVARGQPRETEAGTCLNPDACAQLAAQIEKARQK